MEPKPIIPELELDKYGMPVLGLHSLGGHFADIPKPHIRLYDNPRYKREVTVYIGMYPVGRHYYTAIKEAHNMVWDASGSEPHWRAAWDDLKGRGKVFEEKFDSRTEAEGFVEKMKQEHFPSKTHVVRWSGGDKGYKRFSYRREGD